MTQGPGSGDVEISTEHGRGAPNGLSRWSMAVRDLAPGYFALVMGTGIISLGLLLDGHILFSRILFAITGLAYVVLLLMTLARLMFFRAEVRRDFSGPRNGFSFFTFVAGTNVLGARIAAEGNIALPAILLAVSFLAWLILGYLIPGMVLARHRGDDILWGLNGTWFIWSVASQSVAVLAASLEPYAPGGTLRDSLAIASVLSWGIGLGLYGVIGCAVVIRILTRGISPEELGPPYWVTMGAAAITVLAGSRIVEMTDTPMVIIMREPVAAAAVVLWAFASWLIPALIGLGWWRHFNHRVPLRYEAPLWSLVFPVGMYAVAGIYLGQADRLPIVRWIGSSFLWVAVGVWALVFGAFLIHLVRFLRTPPTQLGEGERRPEEAYPVLDERHPSTE